MFKITLKLEHMHAQIHLALPKSAHPLHNTHKYIPRKMQNGDLRKNIKNGKKKRK